MVSVKVFGYTHKQLTQLAQEVFGGKGIRVDIKEDCLDCKIDIINESECDNVFESLRADFLSEVRYNLYGDEGATLSATAIEYLKLKNKRLSIAESITGGMISSLLIDNNRASDVIFESLITYSNESKIKRLGVSRYTIDSNGAVSYECAYEMAKGLLKILDTDIAVSVTGIAGPTGGSTEKPIGLTYICVADRQSFKVYNHVYQGDRNSIRRQAANTALFYIIDKLKNG